MTHGRRWPALPWVGAALTSIALGAGITLNVQIPFLIVIAFLGVLGLVRLGATLSELQVGQRRFVFLWCALVASTFVWRIRTTTQLDTNPLDAAGMVRVAWIALAVLLLLAWLPVLTRADRRMPLPLRFLGLYVIVALLSAVLSPLPFQALYRVAELAVGLAAVLAAPRLLGGEDVGERILTVLVATIGVILAVAWLEAIVMPSQAWTHLYYYGFIPWTLGGAIPQFSSNTLGMLGALLALWGLSMPRGNFFRGDTAVALILGVATLVATGYRTGLIGFLLASALILWLQRRVGLTLLAGSAAIVVVAIFGASGLQATGQQAISHGQTGSQISSLDSRTFYWNEAQALVKERPVLGWGLNVGSRTALTALGNQSTSTLHSTWFEALVGTGYVGFIFLAIAMISALLRAWRVRAHRLGPPIFAMLVLLTVRSITGTTAELFDIPFLIFGALVVATDELHQKAGTTPTQTTTHASARPPRCKAKLNLAADSCSIGQGSCGVLIN